jgi:hypothetical protein
MDSGSYFPSPSKKLDFRLIFAVSLQLFVWWLIVVLVGTFAGFSNIICVTPLAWLLALRVGNQVVLRSKSALPTLKLTEAGLAGGLLGLLQGILFALVISLAGASQNNEWTQSLGMILVALIASVWIGAGLSYFAAYLRETRRGGW